MSYLGLNCFYCVFAYKFLRQASENVVCLSRLLQLFATSLTDINVEANKVDCLAKRLLKHFSRQQNQVSYVVIGTFRLIYDMSKYW